MQPNKGFEKQIESYSKASVMEFLQNPCSPNAMPYPDVKKKWNFWLITAGAREFFKSYTSFLF